MDQERWQAVKRAFEVALDEPVERRAAFVRAFASGDAALADEVEDLLARSAEMGDFLEPPAGDDLAPGARVGAFTLLEELGRGGMGTVWRAEQDEPRRTVALKLLRPDAGSRDALRRFRREAALLARLSHPGIAQVYEAGTSVLEGIERPWFALELVEGVPIDQHARELTLGKRVELLAQVCDALEHAHARGIVHRDLKPANVLVTRDGRPKVLDFGVARVVEAEREPASLRTRAGMLVGTLEYMSPEQLAGDPSRIDARSDVYALGALLYELCAGKRAHDVTGLAVPEAVRRLAEDEPARLATFDRALRGDLETIVAKALEKDPARRYASAAALARDLRAYLGHRPIAARPASTIYQLGKFARRNRGLVAGVAAAFACLVIGIAGTTRGLFRALAAEKSAEERRVAAQASADEALEIQGFLEGVLASIEPDVARGADTALVQRMLDDATARIAGRFADRPGVEASLRTTLGRSYEAIALYTEAAAQHEQALALRRASAAPGDAVRASLAALGSARMQQFDLGAAEASFREALESARSAKVDAAPLAAALHDLARCLGLQHRQAEAVELYAEAAEALQGPAQVPSEGLVSVLEGWGELLLGQGDLDGAQARLEQALVLERSLHQRPHTQRILCLNALAMLHWQRQDRARAALALDEALAAGRAILRAPHPTIAMQLSNLAMLQLETGDLERAASLSEEALEQSRALKVVEQPAFAVKLRVLGLIEKRRGNLAHAEELYREALALEARLLPREDPGRIETLFNLGQLLLQLGRADEARALWNEALEISELAHGAEGGATPTIRAQLARLAPGNPASDGR